MELCEGGDLASYIERSGRVEERVARNFMRQIGKLIDPSAIPNCSSNSIAHTQACGNTRCDVNENEIAPLLAGAGLQVLRRHHVVHRDLKPEVQ
jgi:serine/threonine-protein kinase ULK/ATG1